MYRMLDLFSGSGSASRAALVRGWDVVRVDSAEGTAADIRADVRELNEQSFERCTGCGSLYFHCFQLWSAQRKCCPDCEHTPTRTTLLWASPPCGQLSTANARTRDVDAGMVLVLETLRLVRLCAPRWWVLENVHGATRAIGEVLGPPVARHGSFYLWGNFPPFDAKVPRDKTRLSGRRRAERRAAIPWAISEGLVLACEALARELPAPT
jgi:hypothetical protein